MWVEKSMYGKKYMGVERSTFLIGKDGRIARSWRKVKVPGHADEVLAAVKALRLTAGVPGGPCGIVGRPATLPAHKSPNDTATAGNKRGYPGLVYRPQGHSSVSEFGSARRGRVVVRAADDRVRVSCFKLS